MLSSVLYINTDKSHEISVRRSAGSSKTKLVIKAFDTMQLVHGSPVCRQRHVLKAIDGDRRTALTGSLRQMSRSPGDVLASSALAACLTVPRH